MANCVMCGLECSGSTCSMCYGDPYHGNDGYYLQWLEEKERKHQEEQQWERAIEELHHPTNEREGGV